MSKIGMLRLSNLLGALAVALTDEIRHAMDNELEVGGSAAAALLMVGVEEDAKVEQLARRLQLAQPTMVRTIALLEERGLLRKERTADRRVRPLSLTGKGEQMVTRLLDRRGSILERLAAALTSSEQTALTKTLEKLLSAAVRNEDQKYLICRLCDENACMPQECPVEHGAAIARARGASASNAEAAKPRRKG